jgi:hypothetical protein
LRHALTNAVAASVGLAAGTIGSEVVVGAVVVVVVVDAVVAADAAATDGDVSEEHPDTTTTVSPSASATVGRARRGIGPT